MTRTIIDTPEDDGRPGQVDRPKEPFVPAPDRIMYPADPAVIRRAVNRKFEAEVRIEVSGQLTRRMIRTAGALEREIREQAEDQVHYDLMAQCLVGYLADASELRHIYMVGDDDRGYRR